MSQHSEEPRFTVADITDEHNGWIIAVHDPLPATNNEREIYLIGHRAWENDEGPQIGLTDKEWDNPRIRGTEYQYSATTPCRVVRQWHKPRKGKKSHGPALKHESSPGEVS